MQLVVGSTAWGGITDDGRIIDMIRCRHLLTAWHHAHDTIRDAKQSKKSRQWVRKVCLIFHVDGLDTIPLHPLPAIPLVKGRLYPSKELSMLSFLLLDITTSRRTKPRVCAVFLFLAMHVAAAGNARRKRAVLPTLAVELGGRGVLGRGRRPENDMARISSPVSPRGHGLVVDLTQCITNCSLGAQEKAHSAGPGRKA